VRTKAAGAAAVIANPSHGGVCTVSVYDAAGTTPYNLAGQTFPTDPILEVTITEGVDAPRTASVILQRQQGARSVAPLVTAGNPLAGLVDVGRRVVITCAVVPPDSEKFYEAITVFDGFIDEVAWPDDSCTLTCTDKTAKLRDTWIETERAYGFATGASATKGTLVWTALAVVAVNDLVVPSQANFNSHFYKVTAGTGSVGSTEPTWPTGSGSTVALGGITYTEVGLVNETGTAVETIIQQVLNDNGLSAFTTLQTPVSPSWLIRPYVQQRSSVADAVKALIDQLGWTCRYEWNTGLGKYELTLKQPNRSATVADKTLSVYEEGKTGSLAVDVYSIRNAVRITYSETASRATNGQVPRKQVEVTDSASITKYGRRYMEVQEADTSQIDSSSEASRMAQAIVDDLKEPLVGMSIVFPVDPYLELGDMLGIAADGLRFSAAQVLATDTLTHRFADGSSSTEVKLRGKPASNRQGWLELDARLQPGSLGQTSAFDTVSATTVTLSPVVGGVCITLSYSLGKGAGVPCVEVHVSDTSGFTPSSVPPSTLRASGAALTFTVAQLVPGKTYYLRIVPYSVDSDGLVTRGQQGAELSFVAGQAQAGHYSSTSTQSHLPLNGNFEHATDDLTSAPPDQWHLEALGGEPAETWGAAGSVYYGTEATTHGRFITLRNTASRGRILSAPFEIRRTDVVWTANLYVSIRRGGASGGPKVQAVLYVYSDAALTNLLGSTVISSTLDAPLGSWSDTSADTSFAPIGNFAVLELSRTTVGSTSVYFDIGDVYLEMGGPNRRLSANEFTANNLAATAGTFGSIFVSAWTAPAFSGSWIDLGGITTVVGHTKDPFGFVRLRGRAAWSGGATLPSTVMVLPAGKRPAAQMSFIVRTGGNGYGEVLIYADGAVVFGYSSAGTDWVSFDGINFDTR
jgi:hypothetical protein